MRPYFPITTAVVITLISWLTMLTFNLNAQEPQTDKPGSTVTQSLQPVPFVNVEISDNFWAPRLETNRKVSLPHSLEMLKKAGNRKNLRLAAEGKRSGYEGPYFIDSDLYKAIEAVSYSLASFPDQELEKQLDEIITEIAAAQQEDGYLNTWIQVVAPEERWTNLRDKHELYCAGHLFEAAVAHHAATGKRTLLDVAIKFADYIDSVFGDEPGKRQGYPGHEEIELALFKLWRATGEQRYYELAKFFLESRGSGFFAREHSTDLDNYDGKHWQDNDLLRDHKKIVGHAVRAVYLMCGATDYAAVSNDAGVLAMLDRVWKNTAGANMYVTGGIGSSAVNEGFTYDFDLPNLSAYQETCASVAMIMWNHRLGLLHGDATFADHMERALYNGFLSGVSLDGKKFFYVNPLASKGNHHRQDWYSCACCPPNVTRTLAQLGSYAYATSPGTLWVNLYIGGSVEADLGNQVIKMAVSTDYPWSGKMIFQPELTSSTEFQLALRIPDWARGQEVILIDGKPADTGSMRRGYLVTSRMWHPGDKLTLELPMVVKRVAANPRVKQNLGRVAIQRGPIVYCLEEADNITSLHQVALPPDAVLEPQRKPDLLGGLVTLVGNGVVSGNRDWTTQLYADAPDVTSVSLTAIPYFAWDNRQPGDMIVWLPTSPPAQALSGIETEAEVTMSFVGVHGSVKGANDESEPEISSDLPPDNCHWWPHKGTAEWVQYEWIKPRLLESSRVFWFDDTGKGQCRIPQEWRLEYRDGDQWKPVDLTSGGYETGVDRWCEVHFEPVLTSQLRLLVQMQDDYAAGVHEWQVMEPRQGDGIAAK